MEENENIKVIQQGAEAKILLNEKDNFIIKDRISKSYRIKELDDRIRKTRTKSEAKILEKASKIINSTTPFFIPVASYQIKMPYINGKKLSEHLNDFPLEKQKQIMKLIGESIAKLHKQDIIHGDLTTSNMILVEDKIPKLFFIDFGLGFISKKIEDKSVDLHLLKQALEAKHFQNWKTLFQEVEKAYEKELGLSEAKKVFERITSVEKRGRYRH
jgi:Kae1-associated kinase Bud32